MPKNEITCIFFEIDIGVSTSNQFCCEIERPYTNLNDISTKLAGKTFNNIQYLVSQHRAIPTMTCTADSQRVLNPKKGEPNIIIMTVRLLN